VEVFTAAAAANGVEGGMLAQMAYGSASRPRSGAASRGALRHQWPATGRPLL
jgi:hypothetical protein